MEDIIHILNQKWAVILAFIPGVNILYLVFRFLTVSDKHFDVPVWMIGIAVFPVWLLYHILPDSWDWLVAHLILSVIAFLYIRQSRGGYQTKFRFRKEYIELICALLVFFTMLILMSAGLKESREVSAKAEIALTALIQEDEETWQSLIHPVYGKKLMNLRYVKNDIEDSGLILSDDFSFSGKSVSGDYHVQDGEALSTERKIHTEEATYRFSYIYQESENGSGFIKFKITRLGKD